MSFKTNAPLWEQAPVLRLILPWVAGIIIYDKLNYSVTKPVLLLIAVLVSFLLCTYAGICALRTKQWAAVHFIALQLFLIIAAFCICCYGSESTSLKQDSLPYTPVIVAADPALKEKTILYEVNLLQRTDNNRFMRLKGKALVYLYKNKGGNNIHRGDTILVPNQWQPVRNSNNPFEPDYQKYCVRQNIQARQFLAPQQCIPYGKSRPADQSLLRNIHAYSIRTIETYITDSATRALLKAMLLGNEKEIEADTRQAYADTGVIHIVSISGAHVAVLFFAVHFCFKWMRQRRYDWVKFLAALILVWFYVLMAGASTPALRAAIMFTTMAIGNLIQRETNPLNQLLTAAFIMLLLQPMWLFTIGFQLSFIAVLSLITFYRPLVSLWQPRNRVFQFMVRGAAASIAAEILVAPLVAYYFHSFPPMFIIANILASLVMGFILCLGMMLIISGEFSLAAHFISSLITVASRAFHYCINALQRINAPCFKTIFITGTGLLLLYMLITALSLFILRKNKRALWFSLGILLLCAFLFLCRSIAINTQRRLIVFNQTPPHSELISGRYFSVIKGDEKETYTTKKAHIGFGSINKRPAKTQDLFLMDTRTILFADSTTPTPEFPVDILVITSAHKAIRLLTPIFKPRKIVIAGKLNNRQEQEWVALCNTYYISLHITARDGAFIFP